jgi:hypothetical protein
MNIHIGQQNAGIINNVEGNMWIHGGQQGAIVSDEGARQAVRELQSALATVTLDQSAAARTRAQITEIDTAMHAPQPDKSRVADMLKRLTGLLVATGSLTTATAAIIGPLQTLAGWLGALGAPILHLLPG